VRIVGTPDASAQDYYGLLGVPKTATDAEITRAFRRLARRLHPDTGARADNVDRFDRVAAAYRVLRNAERRREYDRMREAADAGSSRPATYQRVRARAAAVDRRGAGRDSGRGRGRKSEDDGDDIFAARRPRPRAAGLRPNLDLEAELWLSFDDAVRGTTCQVELDVRTVTARIAAGVADGQAVRIAGCGQPGPDGGPAGDLWILVHVAEHPLFGRKGHDLTVTVPVTFPEVALGEEIRVPTLDRPVRMRLPAGTPTGTTFRIRGRGVPGREGPGDLLVTVKVDVPRQLSDAQRVAVQALAAATPWSPRAHMKM